MELDLRVYGVYSFFSDKTKRGGKAAFTLIEILAVVLIIGILLAAAVPTFVSRRQEARATTIVGDLKAIEAAKNRYIAETGQVSTVAVAPTELVPTYMAKWPEGPFKDPDDYEANAGNVDPTYAGSRYTSRSHYNSWAVVASDILRSFGRAERRGLSNEFRNVGAVSQVIQSFLL
ncbi:MAG: prepilin-type N-terminal cleavage/methylation domain-containing protein [Fimbriimonadaceae bacterium]|jgi:prepilin-type N-terminal cleavage/methylation domain-containing protein|nr:prepilin-type N-terminal cleavage/methylation domain-containing protein [Fimbriimonadaceae bacterium]